MFSHLKSHINTVHCACSLQAPLGKGPSLECLAKILVGEGLPVRESHQKTSRTINTANVTTWKSGQLMLDTIPHSDFWVLQETHSPGTETQTRLGGCFPGRRGGGRARCGQQGRCGDRRAAAHQYELADRVRVDAGRRRFWHQKAWSILCITCEAAFSQDTLTPCSSEALLW